MPASTRDAQRGTHDAEGAVEPGDVLAGPHAVGADIERQRLQRGAGLGMESDGHDVRPVHLVSAGRVNIAVLAGARARSHRWMIVDPNSLCAPAGVKPHEVV